MTTLVLNDMLRGILVYFGVVLLTPLWLFAVIERRLGRGDGVFAGLSEALSLIPGKPGILARRSFYRMTLDECALDAHLGFGTTFAHPQVRVGRGVYIGNRCTLGMCRLDDHVTIGSNVDLLSGRRQHRFDNLTVPIQQQGGEFHPVRVGGNAWIGNSAVIMADVGANAVVGAAAVVVEAIPAGVVAVGNPARIVRRREAA